MSDKKVSVLYADQEALKNCIYLYLTRSPGEELLQHRNAVFAAVYFSNRFIDVLRRHNIYLQQKRDTGARGTKTEKQQYYSLLYFHVLITEMLAMKYKDFMQAPSIRDMLSDTLTFLNDLKIGLLPPPGFTENTPFP